MKNIKLTEDWLLLVKEAMKSEVSKEQFKEFLQSKRLPTKIKKISEN